MANVRYIRWWARAALLGSALSVAEGLLILFNPEYYSFDSSLDYLVLAVEGAALLGILGGLIGLHARQAASYGRPGKAGFLAAFVGTVLSGASHLVAVPFFDFVNVGGMAYVLFALREGFFLAGGTIYVVGVVLMNVGLALLGLATVRSETLPSWSGLALIAGLAGLWAGNSVGWILFGLAWAVVGYALASEKSGPVGT